MSIPCEFSMRMSVTTALVAGEEEEKMLGGIMEGADKLH